MGKIFDNPTAVFSDEILQPERQDLEVFVDGINNIVETQQRVARQYFNDGSIEEACPPLFVLLHIMADGHYQDKDVNHEEVRAMFTRQNLLASDWYRERLEIKQRRDAALWQRHVDDLETFLQGGRHIPLHDSFKMTERLQVARKKLTSVQSVDYLNNLIGTIGSDPLGESRCRLPLS
jgi:hypothetical protein